MKSTLPIAVDDFNCGVAAAAKLLRSLNLAVCRIDPSTKSTGDKGWPTTSAEPADFGPADSIGIICGPLSNWGYDKGALVCIDLDSEEAIKRADDFLPHTAMVEGRRGKPRSHRYFLVRLRTIPDWAISTAKQAAPAAARDVGHPGPFTKSLRHHVENREVLKFVATGGQVVCPPSLHPSGERREWEASEPGEPKVVDFADLWKAVCRLAQACGCKMPSGLSWPWESIPVPRASPGKAAPTRSDQMTERAIAYINTCSPAVSGQGGHDQTFTVARAVVWGFDLGEEEGFRLLSTHYNQRCVPPWSDEELRHKCRDADTPPFDKPRGHLRDAPLPERNAPAEGIALRRTGKSDLVMSFEEDGRTRHKVTVREAGVPVFVDTLNINTAAVRRKFVEALGATVEGVDGSQVEAELVKVAATPAPQSGGDGGDSQEVDVGRLVRPELFHTPDVSGVTIPVMLDDGNQPRTKWRTYLRWACGAREVIDTPRRIPLPDGTALHVHPEPNAASRASTPAWSAPSRCAWRTRAKGADPASVYDRLRERINAHLEFPPKVADATVDVVALWSVLTYCYPIFDAVPYLSVGGPAGSGKSRVMDVLQRLVFRPLATSNLTGPALFRSLHASGGTLLVDEAERLRSTTDPGVGELRSILLAGYRRGGSATRLETVDQGFRPVQFQVYGPKALACIAGLPEALASRCIPIMMFRAGPQSLKTRRPIDADPTGWRSLRDDLHILSLEHGSEWVDRRARGSRTSPTTRNPTTAASCGSITWTSSRVPGAGCFLWRMSRTS